MNPNDPIEPGVWRIIDASCNRVSEGLRTVEEYARFVMDDAFLASELKQLRHDVAAATDCFGRRKRLASRDTAHDVGTAIETKSESQRTGALSVAIAATSRCEQSLRCLEEYGKLIDGDAARRIEACRYRAYTLFATIEQLANRTDRLRQCSVQVLVDGCGSIDEMVVIMKEIANAGADIIQLRDKTLNDRRLYEHAVAAVATLRSGRCLLIINDRPDVAASTGADGVHVGQEELPVAAARRIVGADALVGVSTHSIEQARQAVLDGADYIGCGPTFPSRTKTFKDFPGTKLLRSVADEITLPAFAIGGIDLDNVDQVVETGIHGIAVSSAVTNCESPADTVQSLQRALV